MEQKQNKNHKVRNIIWTFFGIILIAGLALATTTITETKITTPFTDSTNINASNISSINLNLTGDLISNSIHQVSDEGLVGAYSFNNESIFGNIILDSSGTNNDLTDAETAKFNSTGGFNGLGAFEFNSSSKLDMENTVNATSLCSWIKPIQSSHQSQMFVTSTGGGFLGIRSDDKFAAYNGTTTVSSSISATFNEFQHICFVYNNSDYLVYKNGEFGSNIKISKLFDFNRIGNNNANFMNGTLDDILIYNRILSSDEVSQIYLQRMDSQKIKEKKTTSIIFSNDGRGDEFCSTTEDCSNKINDAIDSLSSTGGKIFFRVGTYSVGSSILLDQQGVVLEGESLGGDRAGIQTDSTNFKALSSFDVTTSLIIVTQKRNEINNLMLNGQNSTLHGIESTGSASALSVRNTHSHNNSQNGIFINDSTDSDQIFRDVTTTWNGLHGIMSERNDIRIYNYYSHRNWNGASLMLSNAGGTQVMGMHTFFNKYGIYLNGTDDAVFTNIELESMNKSAIYIDSDHSSVNRISIVGGTFYGNDLNGDGNPHINLDASAGNSINDISIVGVTFDSSTHVFNNSGTLTDISFEGNSYREAGIGSPPNLITLQAFSNSSTITCTSINEGEIYYDGSTNKHLGCDGTNWNALY